MNRRARLAQPLAGKARDLGLGPLVVVHDELAIARAVHVELETLDAELDGVSERGKPQPRSAAVRDHEGGHAQPCLAASSFLRAR
jgi:hypothetical protein